MLASVLKSETAILASVKIMRAFVAMRRFLIQNAKILIRIANVEKHQIETDEKIDAILDKMEENSPKLLPGVTATIHTRYSEQFLTDLKKHNEQYPSIEFIQLPHRHHDRFLIIDDNVHLLGASLKDMGAVLCAVTAMEIAPETILELVK